MSSTAQQLFQIEASVLCIPSLSHLLKAHFKPTWNFHFLVTPSCSPCKKKKRKVTALQWSPATNLLPKQCLVSLLLLPFSVYWDASVLSNSLSVCLTFISQLYPDWWKEQGFAIDRLGGNLWLGVISLVLAKKMPCTFPGILCRDDSPLGWGEMGGFDYVFSSESPWPCI